MRRPSSMILLATLLLAGSALALSPGCAGRAEPLMGPGAVRPMGLADGTDAAHHRERADPTPAEQRERLHGSANTGPIDPERFNVFRASSFASGDGHRLITLSAAGDCAGPRPTQTMRFLSINERTQPDGTIVRTTRLLRHAQENNPIIMRVEYEEPGGRWSMVHGDIVAEMRPLRTHRELYIPHQNIPHQNNPHQNKANQHESAQEEPTQHEAPPNPAPPPGEMRLLATTNHERGSTLWFVANDDTATDGLLINPALSESAAQWRTAAVIEGNEPTGKPTGTARLRSWIAGESNETDLPAGLVVVTELRIELGNATLERDIVRVYHNQAGHPTMRFERSAERTRVMGFGNATRCEFGVVTVDVVLR